MILLSLKAKDVASALLITIAHLPVVALYCVQLSHADIMRSMFCKQSRPVSNTPLILYRACVADPPPLGMYAMVASEYAFNAVTVVVSTIDASIAAP